MGTKKEVKEIVYKQQQVSRFINTKEGEYYKIFLTEKGYKKEDFEKKSNQEKGIELKSFWDSKGWKNTIKRQKNEEEIFNKYDFKNLIKSINRSTICDDLKKRDLIEKAISLEEKEKELVKLQADISTIKAEFDAVI